MAHAIDNKVEAAYWRGDLLKKRRELMGEWADHCSGKQASATATDSLQKELRPKAHLSSDRGNTYIQADNHEAQA